MKGSSPTEPPPASPAQRSELSTRVVSAAVLASTAIATTWYGGVPFAALWAVAGACIVSEWFSLIGPAPGADGQQADRLRADSRLSALRLLAAAGIGALPLMAALKLPAAGAICAATALAAAACWIVLALGRGAGDDAWRRRFGSLIVVWALCGLLAGALAGLLPVVARTTPGFGATLIAWMFAVVWTTDIAAYFTGRAIGGAKLWPRVSPNKTWAGFWGGAAGGSVAGWLVWLMASALTSSAPPNSGGLLAISLLASIAGQGGDLAESALKRRAGVKDSGRIIPGHGGVLDRVDSFLAVCMLVAIGLALGVGPRQ